MWKWIGVFLRKKSSFEILGMPSTKLDWDSYMISIVKTASKKAGLIIFCIKFLSPDFAFGLSESTVRPSMEYCCHVGACVLADGYVGLLVLHLLPYSNPWLIVEM